ncbi:hypothetical protein EVA_13318 [gut metagenome]|uniref:Uncharacterized protein n=1 Tax=gut metagenome TaxID=749906 RepID=J9CF25_9ZZZZ
MVFSIGRVDGNIVHFLQCTGIKCDVVTSCLILLGPYIGGQVAVNHLLPAVFLQVSNVCIRETHDRRFICHLHTQALQTSCDGLLCMVCQAQVSCQNRCFLLTRLYRCPLIAIQRPFQRQAFQIGSCQIDFGNFCNAILFDAQVLVGLQGNIQLAQCKMCILNGERCSRIVLHIGIYTIHGGNRCCNTNFLIDRRFHSFGQFFHERNQTLRTCFGVGRCVAIRERIGTRVIASH